MKKTVKSLIKYTIQKYHSLKPVDVYKGNTDGKELFFLTGYDKSGTTWIKKTLNEVGGFSCIGSNQYFNYFKGGAESDIIKSIKNSKQQESVLNISANHFKDYFTISFLDKIRKISDKNSINFGEKSTAQDLNLIDYYFPKSKSIVLVRDMRDILVSFAFHFDRRYQFRVNNWTQERSKFNIDGTIKDDFIEREMNKISSYYDHLLEYLEKSNKKVLFVKYEDLNSIDGLDFFIKILNFINIKAVDKVEAEKAWNNNTFEKLSKGRKPGEKDATSFYRSGTSKDYLNHLSHNQITRINSKLDRYLNYFEYK